MTLDKQIRDTLDEQEEREVGRLVLGPGLIGRKAAINRVRTSDLGACHQAIRAVLAMPILPGTRHRDIAAAIAEALNIQQEVPDV